MEEGPKVFSTEDDIERILMLTTFTPAGSIRVFP